MKWVVLAIVIVLVPFTWLNLKYRKSGPAFQPYEDMKQRANTTRLLSAGFQRISVAAELPADPMPPRTSATMTTVPGGLPPDLSTTLVDPPLLPLQINRVAAPPSVSALLPYVVRFACTLPDHQRQLAGADLYVRENQIVITPDYEKLAGNFLARTTDNVVQITIPGGTLKAGKYRVTLVGQESSRAWDLAVN